MTITDSTGRKLKIGQIVSVCMFGMFEARVTDIKEVPVYLSAEQAIPPHIVLAMPITPFIQQNSSVRDVYIIREPDDKDLLSANKSGPKLVI